jgi:hypothetical protein
MILDRVPAGRDLPNDFNVIVEIPMNGDPIKYELDKETGAMYVDRFMSTAMFYPCNYGYVPRTLAADGDPLDVLGACLSIPREPRWLGEGADARRAAQDVVSATAKPRNTADAHHQANPLGAGRFRLIRRCRLLIGS